VLLFAAVLVEVDVSVPDHGPYARAAELGIALHDVELLLQMLALSLELFQLDRHFLMVLPSHDHNVATFELVEDAALCQFWKFGAKRLINFLLKIAYFLDVKLAGQFIFLVHNIQPVLDLHLQELHDQTDLPGQRFAACEQHR